MKFKNTLYQKSEGIATITINRPESLNAINEDTISEILSELNDAKKDEKIKVIVVTGAGDRAFSVGADIKIMENMNPLMARELSRIGHRMCEEIERLEKPVIAVINGYALGGGLELAMACDIRIASEKARLGQSEINIGLIPGWGGTQRLPRFVGKGIAKEMIFTGKMISADEALRLGLVNKVVPQDELMEELMKTAGIIASKGKVSLREAKQAVNKGMNVDLATGCGIEIDAFALCYASPDAKEGTTAFLEKRKAEFKGGLSD